MISFELTYFTAHKSNSVLYGKKHGIYLYLEKASAMNNSTNTLSMQMMLNQTMLMRSLTEAVDKCPPNGGYCRTKVSVFITQSPLLRS